MSKKQEKNDCLFHCCAVCDLRGFCRKRDQNRRIYREVHRKTFSGAVLFTDSSKADGFSVSAVPRGSTRMERHF